MINDLFSLKTSWQPFLGSKLSRDEKLLRNDTLKSSYLLARGDTLARVCLLATRSLKAGLKQRCFPGGRYSIYPLMGRCDTAPQTLTLFKTKNRPIFDTLFK